MALVHNNLLGLYSGVSKQAIDLRPSEMVEEMINCYPSLQYGLRRRNPTERLSSSVDIEDNQFRYTYDRGMSGESSEEYFVTIDKVNGLRVFDINSGIYRTVNYEGNAKAYLENSNPEIGFSAITIKDTTFIANKDIIPKIVSIGDGATINYKTITLLDSTYNLSICSGSVTSIGYRTEGTSVLPTVNKVLPNRAPARVKTYSLNDKFYSVSSLGATITITVDSIDITYTVATQNNGLHIYPESMGEFRSNLYSLLSAKLDSKLYTVTLDENSVINIYKLDGSTLSVSSGITYPSTISLNPIAITKYHNRTSIINPSSGWEVLSQSNYASNVISSITSSSVSGTLPLTSNYDKKAHIWIKSTSPDHAYPYTYSCTIYDENDSTVGTHSVSGTSTSSIASDFASWVNGLTNFSATSSGSVCQIVSTNNVEFRIVTSDSYGNQASASFRGVVTTMSDLPKHFPYKDVVVKVTGVDSTNNVVYWVKYDGSSWVEWRDPTLPYHLASSTMPHKLVRNADFTFTLSAITWSDMVVGDSVTQPLPEFIGSNIKDLFFVSGRLGILTRNAISLTQYNNFTNFFRTTILNLLDDSAISTYIDSAKSVGLEYAVELQGSIVLFGDKQQFVLDASRAITPKSISIQPISGYEINRNVKPIGIGDSVMFVVNKGDYAALMEMNKNTLSSNVKADDISAHIPKYIDQDVIQLIGSPRNDMVFLRSRTTQDTIYVYKFMSQNSQKVQSAWSKWVFSVDIKSIFSFDRYLYLLGNRYTETVPTDEFTFNGEIDFAKNILFETTIVYGEIPQEPTFERIDIDPYPISSVFKDNGKVRYDSEVELSEWRIKDTRDLKEMRGKLLLKTMQISSEDGSAFSLYIEDKERGTSRNIPSVYTVNRKPYISGETSNMRIKILSTNGDGFQINSISMEAQYNTRSRRV